MLLEQQTTELLERARGDKYRQQRDHQTNPFAQIMEG